MDNDINSLLLNLADLLSDVATETATLVDYSVVHLENQYVAETRKRADLLRAKVKAIREELKGFQQANR